MTQRQLLNRLTKLQALESQRAQLDHEIESIKGQIKDSMQDSEEQRAGRFVIRWTTVLSNRLDTKALKSCHPALVEQFTKPTTSRRFSIADAQ